MPASDESLTLESRSDGVFLPVRVQPSSRRTGILGHRQGALRVGVAAPPEKGKANDEVVRLLAVLLNIRRSQVELVSGETSRSKVFRIEGISIDEVRSAILPHLETDNGQSQVSP